MLTYPLDVRFHISLLLAYLSCSSVLAYSQSDGRPAHQWITQQGWLLFQSQFGASEIDTYIGEVREYNQAAEQQLANKTRVIQGVYDEDQGGQNPFGSSEPTLRHFWDKYAADFHRDFNDGYSNFDAAPNRAIKYYTGGNGLTGVYEGPTGGFCQLSEGWTCGQGSVKEQGIVWQHQNNNRNRAYYWLGNTMHLMQDMTVPAHSLNDPHLETTVNLANDPDPLHDWVDGRAFSTVAQNGRPIAAFDEAASNRWERWAFVAGQGVGRGANAMSFDNSPLRNFAQLRDIVFMQQSQAGSIPNNPQAATLPLYNLFVETAGLSDDFDSKDRNGEYDSGFVRGAGNYRDFTLAELNEMADVLVPRAMRSTAELIRYFYSQVDSTPPTARLENLSIDPNQPAVLNEYPVLSATVLENISGYDLDAVKYTAELWNGSTWIPAGMYVGTTQAPLLLTEGLYRLQVSAENGAGLIGQSVEYYARVVVPEPTSGAILACGVCLVLCRCTIPRLALNLRRQSHSRIGF